MSEIPPVTVTVLKDGVVFKQEDHEIIMEEDEFNRVVLEACDGIQARNSRRVEKERTNAES